MGRGVGSGPPRLVSLIVCISFTINHDFLGLDFDADSEFKPKPMYNAPPSSKDSRIKMKEIISQKTFQLI